MWLYHITATKLLPTLKTTGLKSAYSRTGNLEASPDGAFVKDREANMPNKIERKVNEFVATLLASGFNRQAIKDTPGQYQPFIIATTSSIDDNEKLDEQQKAKLQHYASLLTKGESDTVVKNMTKAKQRISALTISRNTEIQSVSAGIALQSTHYLSQLARQYVEYRYRIEEFITAKHIYFFMDKHAEDCFRDYTKHLRNPCSILRIRETSVPGVAQDESEYRGKMTTEDVPSSVIQVFDGDADFLKSQDRTADANWSALTSWTG